jgi:isoprenylcysteine carboxyl methyltransferase (ICMT) family protein YpbQ
MRTNWGLILGSFLGLWLSSEFGIAGADRSAWVIGCSTVLGALWIGPELDLLGVRPSYRRIWVKLLGAFILAGVAVFWYWLCPEYRKPLYLPFFVFMREYWSVLAFLVVAYLSLRDRPGDEQNDWLYRFGVFCLTLRGWDCRLSTLVGGVAVRLFFLPLMVSFLGQHITDIQTVWSRFSFDSPVSTVHLLTALFFYVDVSVCVPAYLFACAGLASKIRSVETSAAGLVCALVCYPPFNSAILSVYLPYEDGVKWSGALAGSPVLQQFWAVALVVCLALYAWATVAMGFRFGNLTNKGVVSWGPYRWLKHPAYLAKNTYWWLASVPWLAATPELAFKNCLFLAGISAIYYARAKTEERHMCQDYEYREYKTAIERDGPFSRLKALRAVPRTAPGVACD